jgi:phosphoheptose isomerase
VYALEAAKAMGVKTIAFVGFSGGKSKELADITVHIPSHDYGVVEDAHCVLMHVLNAHLKGMIDAAHGA